MTCPFCDKDRSYIDDNELFFAIYDQYPVSKGHALIISKRHVSSYFDLKDIEKWACLKLLDKVKEQIENELKPDGWNMGVNVGPVAGQTIDHFHYHLIPRYKGDMLRPEGGIRHCVEGKGYYKDE